MHFIKPSLKSIRGAIATPNELISLNCHPLEHIVTIKTELLSCKTLFIQMV